MIELHQETFAPKPHSASTLSALTIRHLLTQQGEPVTFWNDMRFFQGSTPGGQGTSSPNKMTLKPLFYAVFTARKAITEKNSVPLRFVHACCIHPHIVPGGAIGKKASPMTNNNSGKAAPWRFDCLTKVLFVPGSSLRKQR
ncbi:hypothetical protein [Pseudomonas chlororaphis]|uniref:hypothetical protein n=1 Tax=Pseudomonas chlororaphis TaxID=587753 RepID=UPI00160B380B|nr:hypothetical protein [Pseudomonas chlororaphis]